MVNESKHVQCQAISKNDQNSLKKIENPELCGEEVETTPTKWPCQVDFDSFERRTRCTYTLFYKNFSLRTSRLKISKNLEQTKNKIPASELVAQG